MIRSSLALLLASTGMGAAAAPAPSAPLTEDKATEVKYAPPGSWVVPPPAPTTTPVRPEAPVRIIYSDTQVRLSPAGQETYTTFRVKLLKPEALQIGNVTATWNPGSGDATVHSLRIYREGQTIDVLADSKFQVIQREGGLEQSALNGQLTAMLQTPGLQVGDEFEFSATIRQRDPTLGDHAFAMAQLPLQGAPGVFRYRLLWPAADALRWRASPDLPQTPPAKSAGQNILTYELRDPAGALPTEDAPPRFNVRRLVEFSDFASWRDVSVRMSPLFTEAAMLKPNAPLRAEIAKIAAASADPVVRAQVALRLVQDQIRYVYVGLDGGNYRPATADQTWARRFGDCKAKTAVLLAILRELGIQAEPVLVNLTGSDGTDARLPSPQVFNHVLVRATLPGGRYWLDGTRMGDRYLDRIPAPPFRWALPLRPAGGDLEPVAPKAFDRPEFIGVVDVDASAGFDKPAKVHVEDIMRDDDAFSIRTQLAALSPEDADRQLRSYWRNQMSWAEPSQVSWRYDERSTTLVLTFTGEGKPEWDLQTDNAHKMTLWGAGFFPPDRRIRPKEQDQAAPWATDFPKFKCYATTFRMPALGPGRSWGYYAEPIDRTLGATVYWRAVGFDGKMIRTVMSSRILAPELSAADAKTVNDAIAGFNNNMSSVFEEIAATSRTNAWPRRMPFADGVDWSKDASACSAAVVK